MPGPGARQGNRVIRRGTGGGPRLPRDVTTHTPTRSVVAPSRPVISLHTLKRTPGTPQYAKRAANIARRETNRRVPLHAIPHLSPTLGALQQQTHSELIDHAATSDEGLIKILDHLTSDSTPKVPKDKPIPGIPDMAKVEKKPRVQRALRNEAVAEYKTGQPVPLRTEAKAIRTLVRRGKSDQLPADARAQFGGTPFGPEKGRVEAYVRSRRQGARKTAEQKGGGIGGALDKVKNEGLLGLVAPGAARAGRKIVYGTENPSNVQLAVDLGLTVAGGRVLGRAAEAGGPVLGRTLGKVLSRGGSREGLGIVEKAKYAATRAAAAEAGVELGGSRAGKIARTLKKAEQAGGPAAPTRGGTAISLGTKAAGAVGIGGAGKVASRLAEGPGSKTVGRKILSTLRHNVGKATLAAGPAAQVPAVLRTGDPTQFGAAFTGKGAAIGAITKTLGGGVSSVVPSGIAKNLVQDVFSLPAQALPSIYLPLAGLVEASRGDPARLKKLWSDYKKVGLLPAVASGNPSKILAAITAHPLFSALEASGVYAAVGRGGGALGRAAGADAAKTGGRAAKEVSPGMEPIQRPYSKNIITKAMQVARDKHLKLDAEGRVPVGSRHGLRGSERDRVLRDRVTSFMGGNEVGRRAGRADVYKTANDMKPKGVGTAGEDVVSEVAQHFVLGDSIPSFRRTAEERAAKLDTIYREKTDPSLPADERFLKGEAALNRKIAGDLRSAAKLPDEKVARVLESAKTFQAEHSAHSSATQELVARHPEQLSHEQARRRAMFPYAMTHEAHTHGLSNETQARIAELQKEGGHAGEIASLRSQKQLLDAHGNPADYNALEAKLRGKGLEPPAYLSHRLGMRGPGAHYQPIRDRGVIPRRATTGKAGAQGTYDASYAAVEDQLAHTFSTTHRARSFDEVFARFGRTAKNPQTGKDYMPTVSNMDEVRKINEDPAYAKEVYGIDLAPGEKLTGVRLTPLFARARSAAGVKDLITQAKGLNEEGDLGALNPDHGAHAQVTTLDRWKDATSQTGEGPIGLLPETVKKEIDAHLEARSSLGKLFEAYNSGFKTVVLPTSAKWLEANAIEATMRSAFAGLNPLQYAIGKRGFEMYEELFGHEAAVQFKADIAPGAHFAARGLTRKHRTSEQVAGTSEEPVFKLFEAVAKAPTIRTALRLYNGYAKGIFGLNTFLETQPEIAAFGKHLQDELRQHNASWGKSMFAHRDAIKALMEGEGPGGEFQVRAAKSVQSHFGNWSHNTPRMRRILADYSPFGMWLRAATKYVFWTLPRHHPIKTAILASMEEMTQEERSKLGLDVFHSTGEGALPVDSFGLPGPIHVGPINVEAGGVLPTTYFSSFGTAQQALSPAGIGSFVLPQASQVLRGSVDWAGNKLVHPDGTPLNPLESAVTIASKTLEPMVPFSGIIRQLREGGKSPTPTSSVFFPAVRPGSKRSGSIGSRLAGVNPLTPSTTGYLRHQNKLRQISVPATAGGSSSDAFGHLFGSGSSGSSSDPFSHLFN